MKFIMELRSEHWKRTESELHGSDAGGIRAGRSMPIDEQRTNTKLKKEKWEKAKLK